MNWQIILLISVLLYSISIVIQKIILRNKNSDPLSFSILFQLFVGIMILAVGLILNQITLPNIKPILFNIILMVILWTFNNIFLYKAIKFSEASKFSILYSSRAFFTILASSLFLKQLLTINGYIGTFFIILGILFVSIKSHKLTFKKADIFSILAAAGFGFALTNDKFLLGYFNPYTYAALEFLLSGLFLWIIYPNATKGMQLYFQKIIFIKFAFVSALMTLSIILVYSALKLSTNSSQFASINLLSGVIIVILSIVFLKERSNILQKLAGIILSFVGLMLVASSM